MASSDTIQTNQVDGPTDEPSTSTLGPNGPSLPGAFEQISQLIDHEVVMQMIHLQVTAIDRLESTNKSLTNCNKMAQDKLSSTSSLFKKTSKQLSETKRDLDIIYKKILDLKAKIKSEKP